jgi:hypothetical protein
MLVGEDNHEVMGKLTAECLAAASPRALVGGYHLDADRRTWAVGRAHQG